MILYEYVDGIWIFGIRTKVHTIHFAEKSFAFTNSAKKSSQ